MKIYLGLAPLYFTHPHPLGTMSRMTSFERAAAQMKGLRCSYPPYLVAARALDGEEIVALPGNTYEMLAKGLAPSAGEIRVKLFRLRQSLNWSRETMAAFIGVSSAVVRSWEAGRRRPSNAAKRLIWMLDMLVRSPKSLQDAVDFMLWGKAEECAKFASVGSQ
jgi:DNA-binding transcriptional regulator YiaG